MDKIQQQIKDFIEKNNLSTSPEHRTLDALAELGEVAKEMLKGSKYGKVTAVKTDNLDKEIGDVLFSIICIANHFNISIDDAVSKVILEYGKRIQKGGTPDSGV